VAAGPVVFLGPSLETEVARRVLWADYRPPIRRGDLPRVVASGATRVAIIDGEFGQSLSVAVREIRDALAAGIEIWGASSMGALRAAECASLGMRGVGWIYERYHDGRFEADEEVALLFDGASGAPLTAPLVNIRWALERALGEGVLPAEGHDALLAVAQGLPFERRSYRDIVRAAEAPELRGWAEALSAFVARASSRLDRKRLDALELLERLGARA
jgi:hypothetical protein